jgi:hypothetical protein
MSWQQESAVMLLTTEDSSNDKPIRTPAAAATETVLHCNKVSKKLFNPWMPNGGIISDTWILFA